MFTFSLIDVILFFGLGFCCFIGALLVREVVRGYAELFKHVRRAPRYGLRGLFVFVTVICVAAAFSRFAPAGDDPLPVWFIAVTALIVAVGVVCAIHLVTSDLRENLAQRRRLEAHPVEPTFDAHCLGESAEEENAVSSVDHLGATENGAEEKVIRIEL